MPLAEDLTAQFLAAYVIDINGMMRRAFVEPDYTHKPESLDVITAVKRCRA